jgi:hypothetical protein
MPDALTPARAVSKGAVVLKKSCAFLVAGILVLSGCGQPETGSLEYGVTQQGLGRSPNNDRVIVLTQNMLQLKANNVDLPGNWKNFVRCLNDPACNGAGYLPDIMMLTETSASMAQQIRDEIVAQSGVTGWGIYAIDNWRSSSGDWMSNAILYNANRFTRTAAKGIQFKKGDGTSCGLTNSELCSAITFTAQITTPISAAPTPIGIPTTQASST